MKTFNLFQTTWLQQLKIFFATALATSLLLSQPSFAANGTAALASSGGNMTNYLLTLIVGTTAGILKIMNQSPAYIESITEMAESWIETDDPANTIGNSQYTFSSLGDLRTTNEENQISATVSLTQQFLQAGSFNTSKPTLPSNANDLTYSILFGKPIIQPNPALGQSTNFNQNIQNYIKNATGSTLILDQPNPNWPDGKTKTQYSNLYNTLASIESYNQYLISGLATLKNSQDLSAELTAQATDPDWFKQISTEALGLVLRHMLMYVSQSFVQINQMVDLQQKQLAVQAMTNSLMIVLVQSNVGSQLQLKAGQSTQAPTANSI
jgi:hypothetical protein